MKGFQYQIWTSVNRLGKELSSKTNFSAFLQINCFNFMFKMCHRVTKTVKQIKFERVWRKLEAKKCFQRQSFTKYLRQTLFFMLNSALQEQITLHFTSGERKIWSTIKRFQNIMNMIVVLPNLTQRWVKVEEHHPPSHVTFWLHGVVKNGKPYIYTSTILMATKPGRFGT